MKIITTTVGSEYPEETNMNQNRYKAAEKAIKAAVDMAADVIVFPAGFIRADSTVVIDYSAYKLISFAEIKNIAVVFGIDLNMHMAYGLPSFAYGWSPYDKVTRRWQQRSTDSEDQKSISDALCQEKRLLNVNGELLGVLISGEIFNDRIRESLTASEPKVKIVVDAAHVTKDFEVWNGMEKYCRSGIASLCSVHTAQRNAMKHGYDGNCNRISDTKVDRFIDSTPHIEMKLWLL